MKTELIAPAGSLEKLKYAMEYGADAVYCGIPEFSLRVKINKFTKSDLKKAIEYAHARGKKIYITINILSHNRHLAKLSKYLAIFKDNMPDAFVVADIGTMQEIKKILTRAKFHLSTQANCTNWQTAKFYYDLGFKRIVLARELTLLEIAEIHRKVPKLELESFVHGAMCMSYSGRCLLSSWQVERSANLGDCTQPCRWKYYMVEDKRRDQYIPIEEDKQGTYIMNSKDLCLAGYLDKLAKAGVSSFKIEGRSKSVYYVAAVTKIYRQIINSHYDKKIIAKAEKELAKITNREYTTGFILGKEKYSRQNTRSSHADSTHLFVGQVLSVKKNKKYEVIVCPHNYLCVGDEVEFLQPHQPTIKHKITEIIDKRNGNTLKSAHGGNKQIIVVSLDCDVEEMSVLRKEK